ncbi:MAG: alpha-1,4-glucan--maltose-1-phosphate maltosyltransferase [Myxococcota bacterium]
MARRRPQKPSSAPEDERARRRVTVEGVEPRIDCGRFPVKRVIGDRLVVEADLVADGHDAVAGCLRYRHTDASDWHEVPLDFLVNDRWRASFEVTELGRWQFTVEGWPDPFTTWRDGLHKKVQAGQDVAVDVKMGAELVRQAAARASGDDGRALAASAATLAAAPRSEAARAEQLEVALGAELAARMARHPDRSLSTRHEPVLEVVVDRPRARFGSWYELFPRSFGPGRQHGTFRDAENVLPHVAGMGFDVLYLPPIHPIGRTFRKGRNNTLQPTTGDPGSPWAIGAEEGGHMAVHPELGTLEDFRRFRDKAEEHGLEVALDIAFQASPDHPWVEAHPEWFVTRPDGTIQYAENPPKKYQDIYPLNFDSPDWRDLWQELRDVFEFWIDQGVRIFRVDNPHTKPLSFWEWCLADLKSRHRDLIFLSEAFTRPKLMYLLAKMGFTQSYTYFTWRNSKWELTEYMNELTRTEVAEFFRPSFWPNTPDILPEHLQHGGRPAFISRLVLASTLSSNYGMYGPAFELMEHEARPGSGEYLDNEKYEIKDWDLERPDSLRYLIERLNRARRTHSAFHDNRSLTFHPIENDQLLCYSKHSPSGDDVVLVVVNLDFHHRQSGFVELDLDELGLDPAHSFEVHDLIGDARYTWQGHRNYVELDPQVLPAHVFHVERYLRTERDFEGYR